MEEAGLHPDPWQRKVLESAARQIALLCSRQVGKSTVAAALALKTALLEAPATVLVVSPSERQSGETIRKVKTLYWTLAGKGKRAQGGSVQALRQSATDGARLDAAWARLPAKERESALQMHLANGSRIVGLPGNEGTIRGFSDINLLVIDEASGVPDQLYFAVRPMLAVSHGRLLALTTPKGKRGWFWEVFEKWKNETDPAKRETERLAWERYEVRAEQCPRITPAFLAEEKAAMGDVWFRQEYGCSFEDVVGAVFRSEDVDRMLQSKEEPYIIAGVNASI
jgi:hypothetical protein